MSDFSQAFALISSERIPNFGVDCCAQVGLVSDEKLIELLDLAMAAEAVCTVRCMRDLLDGGVEPLALVSQLATLITDILAGTYVVSREQLNRGLFFRRSCESVDPFLPRIETCEFNGLISQFGIFFVVNYG